jgi:hypothetical protein
MFKVESGKCLEFSSQGTGIEDSGSIYLMSPADSLEATLHLVLKGSYGTPNWHCLILPSELREAWAGGDFFASATGTCADEVSPQSLAKVNAGSSCLKTSSPSALCSLTFPKSHLEHKSGRSHGAPTKCTPVTSLPSTCQFSFRQEIIWLVELGIIKIHSLSIFPPSRQI